MSVPSVTEISKENVRSAAERGHLPRMPASSGEGARSREIRRFHLTGGASSADAPRLAGPRLAGPRQDGTRQDGPRLERPRQDGTLMPVALAGSDPRWPPYPFFLPEPDDAESPGRGLAALIEQTLSEMERDGQAVPILRGHAARLARTVGQKIKARGGPVPLSDVLSEAFADFARQLDVSEAAAAVLAEEIGRLEDRLPRSGTILELGEQTFLSLYVIAMRKRRRRRLAAFLEQIDRLAVGLSELLRLDAVQAPAAPEALGAGLGGGSEVFVDSAALAHELPPRRGSQRLPPERRARLEQTLATLRRGLDDAREAEDLVLVHSGRLSAGLDLSRVRVVERPDPLAVAVGLFEERMEGLTEVLRAVRVARLELRGHYDSELHDDLLARFDWQAMSAEELLLAPPIAVVETAERLRGNALGTFSELLCSARPVHVLLTESVAGAARRQDLSGYHPGLGYLAVAHREAFVLCSTLAQPEHLASGLEAMAEALGPAVTLVASPSPPAPVSPWLQLAAAHAGRATPSFCYDPAAGSTWAERFDLEANPAPREAWPAHHLACLDAAENEQTREVAFTFADAAVLDPTWREHFQVLDPAEWSDEQIEIAAYLETTDEERQRLLPFVWVVGESGKRNILARAVVTRELVFACRDRQRAWRILQELAGTRNEHARRAAEAARQQALAEAEEKRRELQEAHAAELEKVRAQAVGEAMDRLVAVLMDVGTTPGAALPGALPATTASPPGAEIPTAEPAPTGPEPPIAEPAVSEEAAVATADEDEDEDEDVSFDGPWIDSDLCTTCNDCINLNPQLFQYNENKQAVIADPRAGTFLQLVTAAEKCPAKCIHPGAAPTGDSTVTDDLIARAASFD